MPNYGSRSRPGNQQPKPYTNKKLESPQDVPRELVDPGWLPPGDTEMRRQMAKEGDRQFGGRAYIQKIPPGGSVRPRGMTINFRKGGSVRDYGK
jgi:hypothetical protein